MHSMQVGPFHRPVCRNDARGRPSTASAQEHLPCAGTKDKLGFLGHTGQPQSSGYAVVAARLGQLERGSCFKTYSGPPSHYRHVANRVGVHPLTAKSPGEGLRRDLVSRGSKTTLQLQRTVDDLTHPRDIWSSVARKVCPVSQRQCHYSRTSQSSAGVQLSMQRDLRKSKCPEHFHQSSAPGRVPEPAGGLPLPSPTQARMGPSSGSLPDAGSSLGTSSGGSICNSGQCSASLLQQQVSGSSDKRCGRLGPELG